MASEEKSGYPENPEGGTANPPSDASLSTRRARLRGSLGQASTKDDIKALAEQGSDSAASGVIPAMVPGKGSSIAMPVDFDPANLIDVLRNVEKSLGQMAGKVETIDPAGLDELLNVCATNVAAVQGLAQEQLETMKELKDTLANQTFYEVGIKLNGLSDTIQQAMEPTKALADLIDVLDQMVATMQDREQRMAGEITSDQLVMNLADQLANGTIDSWTFKCAYMAVFPEDHPADLLRRLVELLGTQRLTEDLFRAAYEAVQAPNPPKRAAGFAGGGTHAGANVLEELIAVENEEIAAQLEALHAANEELQRAMQEREEEFEQLLQANQIEKDELKTRYEEIVERSEDVANQAQQREDEYQALLSNKDMALSEKESEAAMLRHQIEELRSETEHMVKDMQTQLTEIKKVKQDTKSSESSSPSSTSSRKSQSSSFFDTAPVPPKPSSTFEPAVPVHEREIAARQAEQAAAQPAPQPASAPAPQQQAPAQPAPQAPAPQPAAQAPAPQPAAQAPAPQPAAQAPASVPGAPTTGLTSGPGSYGSGVRAQVFEVIVRQALAGAHWREICAGPMQVNNISPEEVEAEVKRRQALLNK